MLNETISSSGGRNFIFNLKKITIQCIFVVRGKQLSTNLKYLYNCEVYLHIYDAEAVLDKALHLNKKIGQSIKATLEDETSGYQRFLIHDPPPPPLEMSTSGSSAAFQMSMSRYHFPKKHFISKLLKLSQNKHV